MYDFFNYHSLVLVIPDYDEYEVTKTTRQRKEQVKFIGVCTLPAFFSLTENTTQVAEVYRAWIFYEQVFSNSAKSINKSAPVVLQK